MAVDGTYKIAGDAMGTKLEGTLELKSAGATLAGTARIGSQVIELEDGKASGDTFTGRLAAPTPMGTMKFKVNGTVAGDKISGTLKAMMVSAKFEGSRVK